MATNVEDVPWESLESSEGTTSQRGIVEGGTDCELVPSMSEEGPTVDSFESYSVHSKEVAEGWGETPQDVVVVDQPCTQGSNRDDETTTNLDFGREDKADAETAENISFANKETLGEVEETNKENKCILDFSKPSMEKTKTSKITAEANHSQFKSNEFSEYLLLGLPTDALHAVASFLTPKDFCYFGLCSSSAAKVVRDVVRKVRIHGFRCATEVVTSWVSTLTSAPYP
jgi:hypothetical protein